MSSDITQIIMWVWQGGEVKDGGGKEDIFAVFCGALYAGGLRLKVLFDYN